MADGTIPTIASNDRVVGTYDRIATLYDWFVADLEAPTRAQAIWTLGPRSGERILDVGCGGGHALVEIADDVGPDGTAHGLDASPGMLDRARDRLDATGATDGATLALGDARALPYTDDRFDAVYLGETLELFGECEMATVLEEVRRVLRPDGRLVVASMDRAGWENSAFVRTYEWVYRHVPGYATVGCRPIYVADAVADADFEVEYSEQIVRAGLWPIAIVRGRPR